MKWEWFEIKEIKDVKKLRLLFILFSPILFLCFLQAYAALIMVFGGGWLMIEILKIKEDTAVIILYTLAALLAFPSVIGSWKSYKRRKMKNLAPTAPFMI